MNGITRKPRVLGRSFALLSAAVGRSCAGGYFRWRCRSINLDVKMSRDDALAARRPRSQTACISRPPARAPPSLFTHDGATQNFVELGGRRQAGVHATVVAATLYCAVLVGGAAVQAGRNRRGARALSSPTARIYGFTRKLPESEPRRRARSRRRRARSPRRARATTGRSTSRAYKAARAIAAASGPTGASITRSSTSAMTEQARRRRASACGSS